MGTKGFTEAQEDAAADAISTGIESVSVRRLASELRRLAVTVTDASASQETELCAADDTTCGQTDTDLTGATTVITTATGVNLSSSGGARIVDTTMSVVGLALLATMIC